MSGRGKWRSSERKFQNPGLNNRNLDALVSKELESAMMKHMEKYLAQAVEAVKRDTSDPVIRDIVNDIVPCPISQVTPDILRSVTKAIVLQDMVPNEDTSKLMIFIETGVMVVVQRAAMMVITRYVGRGAKAEVREKISFMYRHESPPDQELIKAQCEVTLRRLPPHTHT